MKIYDKKINRYIGIKAHKFTLKLNLGEASSCSAHMNLIQKMYDTPMITSFNRTIADWIAKHTFPPLEPVLRLIYLIDILTSCLNKVFNKQKIFNKTTTKKQI